jgi:hypothetical protein
MSLEQFVVFWAFVCVIFLVGYLHYKTGHGRNKGRRKF